MENTVEQKRFFTEAELVTFGNYLLSETRKKAYRQHPELKSKHLKDRLSQVNHADLENFKACIS
jgi:hypothetical protein